MARIMVADDSDAIRMVLKDILSTQNHIVVCEADNGEDAIQKFSETKPEVLLLDLNIPKKDGLTVVKEILTTHPDAKIVLITASNNQTLINQCLNSGASGYVAKPFEFDEVLKTISNICSN